MTTEAEEYSREDREDVADTALSSKTVLLLLFCTALFFIVVLIKLAMQFNTDPYKECAYRGGTWNEASEECLYEDGMGGTVQRVGMTISKLTFMIPNEKEEVSFESVDIGSPKEYQKIVSFSHGEEKKIQLLTLQSRTHAGTGDLLLPFFVHTERDTLLYMALFKKEGPDYVHTDNVWIAQNVGPERLTLIEHSIQDTYTVRFMYRDRFLGEKEDVVPKEPKVFEADVFGHRFVNYYTHTRDGIEHGSLIYVTAPQIRKTSTNPLIITGSADADLFIEGRIPLKVQTAQGVVLGETKLSATKISTSTKYTFSGALHIATSSISGEEVFVVVGDPRGGRDTHVSFPVKINF